ncbi:hypothetical protein PPTG_24188 [Phytophthora nicotianae INRA-310]|uniref:Uncharacterized protein n=1 Tax=Phytophthora nicotianae (strain INRA-310) TaxID=761204 RepID=W2PIL9_PHYN3|nr:hypothetical protein PPTG_24188 [Phytophthora nicotianae INRA-310]ETN00828.1 hypothetical protein PPTG_24188 [Phytophthora nicotianae INRA-310]
MELSYGSRITHQFEVIGNTRDGMVIGRDLLSELGIIVNFRDGMVEWNGNTVSVSTGQKVSNPDKPPKKQLPVELKEVGIAEEVKEINDTSVKPKEMIGDEEIDQVTYEKVVKLLNVFETLYKEHLGKMKMPDYVLPVTESFKPVHARPYSIQDLKKRLPIRKYTSLLRWMY